MDAFSQVLSALTKADVRYLVVGGVAVNAHGYQRFTRDLDLVLDLHSDNLAAALVVFEKLGFSPRIPAALEDFANESIRRQWIVEKGLIVFSLVSDRLDGLVLDLFAECPIRDFDEAYKNAFFDLVGDDQDISVPFLSLDALIEMKKQAGRPVDLQDVEQLVSLRDEHEK